MYTLLVLFHILVCILLIVVVLMQAGKGGGISGAFGGSGTSIDSMFGAKGTTGFMVKMTIGLAILFMVLCVVHSFVIRPNQGPASLMEQQAKSGGSAGQGMPIPLSNEEVQNSRLPGAEQQAPGAPAPATPQDAQPQSLPVQ